MTKSRVMPWQLQTLWPGYNVLQVHISTHADSWTGLKLLIIPSFQAVRRVGSSSVTMVVWSCRGFEYVACRAWCGRSMQLSIMCAASMWLPSQPVATGSKDFNIEGLDKLHDSVVEEPACEGWVLNYCPGTVSPGVRVVRVDESCQLWPLEVCCIVSVEGDR